MKTFDYYKNSTMFSVSEEDLLGKHGDHRATEIPQRPDSTGSLGVHVPGADVKGNTA